MPERLVLDPPSAFVQLVVGQLDEVERVDHLDNVGKDVGEGLAVGAGEVQHPEADRLAPVFGTGRKPRRRARRGAARHHVEQLGPSGAKFTIEVAHR